MKNLLEPARSRLAKAVQKAVASTPIYDIHTHLYDPAFGDLLLWGIDDLLVYHYLVAEVFRYSSELRSMTSGRGSFELEFSHYEQVPQSVAQRVITETQSLKNGGNGK